MPRRADKMIESSRVEAEQAAAAPVAGLTAQADELRSARDAAKEQLTELRAKIDKALSIADPS